MKREPLPADGLRPRLGFRRTLSFLVRRADHWWYADWNRLGWTLAVEKRGWFRWREVMLVRETYAEWSKPRAGEESA